MKQIRIAFAALFIIPILALSPLYAFLPAAFMKGEAKDRYLRRCGHFIGSSICFFLGIRVHVDGRENVPDGGNVCYMSNHQSMLDIASFVGPARLWASVIVKAEIKKVPVINMWCTALDCVYIERKSPHDSVKAIFRGVEKLKEGGNMLIYPEGTRSKSGAIGEMKNGSLKLATRAKATIVPVTVKGMRAGLESIRNFKIVDAYVSIGEPISTADLDDEAIKNLDQVVYGAIAKRYEELPGQY
jgi:1-acyl-sn-glycerol-3-phosphate acyltransferase